MAEDKHNDRTRTGRSVVLCLVVLMGLVLLAGCHDVDPAKGYTSRSLYSETIQTVYVPPFDSQSFYRDVEPELTRAVCQQIELHTPYKVISDPGRADTILRGRIQNISESVLSQQRELDRPLENRQTLVVYISWKDLRSGDFLINNKRYLASADYAVLQGAGRRNATLQAVNDLALRIVEDMEQPW